MVDNYYQYVENRMRQMGVEKFSVRPVFINETINAGDVYRIDAGNRWLFLISESVDPDLVIVADNNIFNDADNYGTYNFNYIQEFTGGISITVDPLATEVQLEFIEVVPEVWSPNPTCICIQCSSQK